jgi:hypothetical protein
MIGLHETTSETVGMIDPEGDHLTRLQPRVEAIALGTKIDIPSTSIERLESLWRRKNAHRFEGDRHDGVIERKYESQQRKL